MYGKYVDVLAKHAQVVFQEMTGTEILNVQVKIDERFSGVEPMVHVIEYEHLEKKVKGNFVLGFASSAMTVAVASGLAEKMGLEPVTEIDDIAADLIGEFLNTIVGRAISDWDRMGMPVRFSPPKFMKSARLQQDDQVTSVSYVIILSLAFSHVIFHVSFSEESSVMGESKRILVVEDSAVIRNIIAKTLSQLQYEVAQAENGLRATQIYPEFHPHLVLMDLVMPEMGGMEAMESIRKTDPDAKFIVLTSSARKDEVLSAKKLGVLSYLIKPFNPDSLIREVNKALQE